MLGSQLNMDRTSGSQIGNCSMYYVPLTWNWTGWQWGKGAQQKKRISSAPIAFSSQSAPMMQMLHCVVTASHWQSRGGNTIQWYGMGVPPPGFVDRMQQELTSSICPVVLEQHHDVAQNTKLWLFKVGDSWKVESVMSMCIMNHRCWNLWRTFMCCS